MIAQLLQMRMQIPTYMVVWMKMRNNSYRWEEDADDSLHISGTSLGSEIDRCHLISFLRSLTGSRYIVIPISQMRKPSAQSY